MRTRLRLWFVALSRRTRFENQLDDELAFHMQPRAEEWERRGLSAAEARRRARIEFGNVERIKEETRDVRLGAWLELLRQDLRYGFRVLRAHPGVTAVGVASLALGMAVCIYMFLRLDAGILRPLPGARDPGSLVAIDARLSYPAFERIRDVDDVVEAATAYLGPAPFTVAVGREAGGGERVFGHLVSSDYFKVLGVAPTAGRVFTPGTERVGSEPVVVVSERFWRRRLDADPGAVGRSLRVNGQSVTLAGIAANGFQGVFPVNPVEIFVPVTAGPALLPELEGHVLSDPTAERFEVVARLARGVSTQTAEAALDATVRAQEPPIEVGESRREGPRVRLLPAGRAARVPPAELGLMLGVNGLLVGLVLAGVREPGRAAVGARREAAAGDGRSLRAGRQPPAAGPAVADRERAAGAGRCRSRARLLLLAQCRRRVGGCGDPVPGRDRSARRTDVVALHVVTRRTDRNGARTGTGPRGDPRDARRRHPVLAGGATVSAGPLSPVRCQEPVRHVSGGRGPHASAHHRPVGRRLPAVQRHRRRVRHRRPDAVHRGSGARRLYARAVGGAARRAAGPARRSSRSAICGAGRARPGGSRGWFRPGVRRPRVDIDRAGRRTAHVPFHGVGTCRRALLRNAWRSRRPRPGVHGARPCRRPRRGRTRRGDGRCHQSDSRAADLRARRGDWTPAADGRRWRRLRRGRRRTGHQARFPRRGRGGDGVRAHVGGGRRPRLEPGDDGAGPRDVRRRRDGRRPRRSDADSPAAHDRSAEPWATSSPTSSRTGRCRSTSPTR